MTNPQPKQKTKQKTKKSPLLICEFFSGIGGFHFAIQQVFSNEKKNYNNFKVVKSFDINTVANEVG